MSATTTERQESSGFVGETVRRPIQDAVREGVREALQEEADIQGGGRSGGDEGGGSGGKFALLAVLGIGMAAFLLWRRRSGGSGDEGGITESIRSQSKTDETGLSDSPGSTSGSERSETSGGAVGIGDESDGSGDATPEASSE